MSLAKKHIQQMLDTENTYKPSKTKLGGMPPKIISIYSLREANTINKDTSYEQVKDLLSDKGLDTREFHEFLLYNKNENYFQISMWRPGVVEWGGMYPISGRKNSLKRLTELTQEYFYEFKEENTVLTYPHAYKAVRRICQNIAGRRMKIPYELIGQKAQ